MGMDEGEKVLVVLRVYMVCIKLLPTQINPVQEMVEFPGQMHRVIYRCSEVTTYIRN